MKKRLCITFFIMIVCSNLISMEQPSTQTLKAKSNPNQDLLLAIRDSYENGQQKTIPVIIKAIKNGANPNQRYFNPLLYAFDIKKLPLVLFLLAHGADMDAVTQGGIPRSYLKEMTFNSDEQREQFITAVDGFLLQHEIMGEWPTMDMKKELWDALKRGDLKTVVSLFELWGADFGITPNSKDMSGRTPLMYAVLRDDKPMINLLLEYGADPDVLDNTGENAASIAVARGYNDIQKLFALAEQQKESYKSGQARFAKQRVEAYAKVRAEERGKKKRAMTLQRAKEIKEKYKKLEAKKCKKE